jgi:hypothetical protein
MQWQTHIPTIQWTNLPLLVWGESLALILILVIAFYNTRSVDAARRSWDGLMSAGKFAPRSSKDLWKLWFRWWLLFAIMVATLAGPNATDTPDEVRAGAVQVEFAIDVSNSMCAEENRPFLKPEAGESMPGSMYQWGTRIDQAKRIILGLLPQLRGNQVGLVTIEGSGYNMWDLTWDHNSPKSAFQVILNNFVNCGAAPGSGADYASGIEAALKEFSLPQFNDSDRERFLVLFTDGGFTGDEKRLQEMEQKLEERNVHLLLVGLGGATAVTVPKYDPTTHKRNGLFQGTTSLDTTVLMRMRSAVLGSDLITVPPGTFRMEYSFPQKAGGLYAAPKQANLAVWFLSAAILVLLSITFGGNKFLPRLQLVVPPRAIYRFTWLRAPVSKLLALITDMTRHPKGD